MSDAELSKAANDQWEHIVNMSLAAAEDRLPSMAERISMLTNSSPKTALQKIRAIRHAVLNGCPRENVVKMGQHAVLTIYGTAIRKAKAEPMRYIRHLVPATLADAWNEHVVLAAHKYGGLKHSDELIELIVSEFIDWSPARWRHAVGEPKLRKRRDER